MSDKSSNSSFFKQYMIGLALILALGGTAYLSLLKEQKESYLRLEKRLDRAYTESAEKYSQSYKLVTAEKKRTEEALEFLRFEQVEDSISREKVKARGFVCVRQWEQSFFGNSTERRPQIALQIIGDTLFWKDTLGTFAGSIDSIVHNYDTRGEIYLDMKRFRTVVEYDFRNDTLILGHLPDHEGRLYFAPSKSALSFGKRNTFTLDPVFSSKDFKKVLYRDYSRIEWRSSLYVSGKSILPQQKIKNFLYSSSELGKYFVFETGPDLYSYDGSKVQKVYSAKANHQYESQIRDDTLYFKDGSDLYCYSFKSKRKALYNGDTTGLWQDMRRVKKVVSPDEKHYVLYDSNSLDIVWAPIRSGMTVLNSPQSKEWSLGEQVVWNKSSSAFYGTTSGVSTGIWQYKVNKSLFTKIIRDVKSDAIQVGASNNELFYLSNGNIYQAVPKS